MIRGPGYASLLSESYSILMQPGGMTLSPENIRPVKLFKNTKASGMHLAHGTSTSRRTEMIRMTPKGVYNSFTGMYGNKLNGFRNVI